MADPKPAPKPSNENAEGTDPADGEDEAVSTELPLEENDFNAQPE